MWFEFQITYPIQPIRLEALKLRYVNIFCRVWVSNSDILCWPHGSKPHCHVHNVVIILYNVSSVNQAMFSTSGDIMRTSGISWVHREDIMSTSGDIMMHVGGFHEYIRGCLAHRGFQYKSKALWTCSPTWIMISPRCTQDISPDVFIITQGGYNALILLLLWMDLQRSEIPVWEVPKLYCRHLIWITWTRETLFIWILYRMLMLW